MRAPDQDDALGVGSARLHAESGQDHQSAMDLRSRDWIHAGIADLLGHISY